MIDLIKVFSKFSMTPNILERIDIVVFDVMDTAVRSHDRSAIRPVVDFNSWLKREGVKTFWMSADPDQGHKALHDIGIHAPVYNLAFLLAQQPANTKFAAVNDSFLPVLDAEAWIDPHDEKSGKPFLERKQYKLASRVPA